MRYSYLIMLGLFIAMGLLLKKDLSDAMMIQETLTLKLGQIDGKLNNIDVTLSELRQTDDYVMEIIQQKDAQIEFLNNELLPVGEWKKKLLKAKGTQMPVQPDPDGEPR